MNPRTRQRAMRSLLASLLQSELSTFDIEEIANEMYFGSLGKEMGEFVRDAMVTLADAGRNKPKLLPEGPSIQSIQEIIVRRQLPKKSIMQLMTLAAPRIKLKQIPASASVSELVDKFLKMATSSEARSFVSILEGEPADAYLKGISGRGREK